MIDVHHPLEAMQRANERDDPAYTILKDKIHLTDAAYVGWGYSSSTASTFPCRGAMPP